MEQKLVSIIDWWLTIIILALQIYSAKPVPIKVSSKFRACPDTVFALRWCNDGRAHRQVSLVSTTFRNKDEDIAYN